MEKKRERVIVRHDTLLEKACPVCGKSFEGLGMQNYCSVSCRNKASYQRHAGRRRAARRSRYVRQKESDNSKTEQ